MDFLIVLPIIVPSFSITFPFCNFGFVAGLKSGRMTTTTFFAMCMHKTQSQPTLGLSAPFFKEII